MRRGGERSLSGYGDLRVHTRDMRMFRSLMVVVLTGFVSWAVPINVAAQSCTGNPVTVQILGSGGPRVNPDRASASYLLWIGSQAKVLVDTGGGSYLRFGQSRAQLADLSLVVISHLHPDHVADLPAILWTSTILILTRRSRK